MKHVKRIKTERIIPSDERFDFYMEKQAAFIPFPNVLPLFWEHEGGYIPIVPTVYMDKAEPEIVALVYDDGITYESVLKDILEHEDLHLFQIANVIMLLERYAPDHSRSDWVRILKIGSDQWDVLIGLATFQRGWAEYFISKKTPLKRILHFSDPDLREVMTPLLELNPGINILELIADLMRELVLRDSMSYERLWISEGIPGLLKNKELSPAAKLQAIRGAFTEKRFPVLSAFRSRTAKEVSGLSRANGVRVSYDDNFETPGLTLTADLKKKMDIDKLIKWLKEEQNTLEKILDTQKGNE